jgi:hypothetical protein
MSFKQAFDPLDLEIIYRVYETAWSEIEADNHLRDVSKDDERKEAFRKRVFALVGTGPVDFDALYEKVMGSTFEPWIIPSGKMPRGSPPSVGA